jgi:hypothetical protein
VPGRVYRGIESLTSSVRSLWLRGATVGAPPSDGRIVVSPEASQIGARLDEHHAPETNGRMAVCRRCGAQTNGPDGRQHVPDERRLPRYKDWLDARTPTSRIGGVGDLFKE